MDKKKLNSFQKHKFEEERAKEILAYCFPIKYQAAELSESPDIIVPSLSIGVEVTQSLCTHIHQNMERASSISGKTDRELSAINKKNIQKGIVTTSKFPDGRYLAGFSVWGNTHSIKNAFDNKMQKLNAQHFTRFDENNLFVISWMIDQDELDTGIQYILQKSALNSNSVFFNIVYIFTGKKLICIQDHNLKVIDISAQILKKISETAFLKVVAGTKNKEPT